MIFIVLRAPLVGAVFADPRDGPHVGDIVEVAANGRLPNQSQVSRFGHVHISDVGPEWSVVAVKQVMLAQRIEGIEPNLHARAAYEWNFDFLGRYATSLPAGAADELIQTGSTTMTIAESMASVWNPKEGRLLTPADFGA
jgi:hypothetical protein